jgi:tyrosyl-tRNA synthetase
MPLTQIAIMDAAMEAGQLNPMTAKRALGRALAERYYSAADANAEEEWFTRVFSARAAPAEVPVVHVGDPNCTLLGVLRKCLPAESATNRRRLIADGSVRLTASASLPIPISFIRCPAAT